MKDTLVILMDCWDYKPGETSSKDNLRSTMCKNINDFVEDNSNRIHMVVDAHYDLANRPAHPDISKEDWRVSVLHMEDVDPVVQIIHDQKIKNVYYLGIHWNRCIRNRQLGYVQIMERLQGLGIQVNIYTVKNCTLENIHTERRQHAPVYERVPDFASDPVTELKHVEGDIWQILGTRKDWNGKI